jgi:pyruvate dehydrogenase E1 component beta subunit
MDQIANNAAKWRYGSGSSYVPIVIRSIIGRGWGQGAQHSQSLQSIFAHFPGLKVVMPATPYDAKGLLIGSIRDNSPVIFIEHRQLYEHEEPVPEECFEVPLGKAIIRHQGTDITIVATSLMVTESLKAADILENHGISAEVIDLRTISPMDDELIYDSVRRTHRLLVADTSWRSGGIGSEIIARAASNVFHYLKAPAQCIASPDVPSPVSSTLEKLFYPGVDEIVDSVIEVVNGKPAPNRSESSANLVDEKFHGPF